MLNSINHRIHQIQVRSLYKIFMKREAFYRLYYSSNRRQCPKFVRVSKRHTDLPTGYLHDFLICQTTLSNQTFALMLFPIFIKLNPFFYQSIRNIYSINLNEFFKILHILDLSFFFSLYLNLHI